MVRRKTLKKDAKKIARRLAHDADKILEFFTRHYDLASLTPRKPRDKHKRKLPKPRKAA